MAITFSGSGNPVNVNGTDQGFTIVSDTAKSATGTSVDFTGIPSWVKRITVMFDGLSQSGTSPPRLQLGTSGGIETTGYTGYSVRAGASNNAFAAYSAAFDFNDVSTAAILRTGEIRLTLLSSNLWIASGLHTSPNTGSYQTTMCGAKTLSDTLTQLRITTANGTDTFDSGTINIMYE